jgi:hypothetical protein
MLEILKGNVGKDKGCASIGIAPRSVYNYFKEIGTYYLKLDEEDNNIKTMIQIYAEFDEGDEEEKMKSFPTIFKERLQDLD